MIHGLRQFARLLKLSAILSRYRLDEFLEATHLYRPMRLLRLVAPWGRRGLADKPRGERLRLALQEMGPIYVKFGQMEHEVTEQITEQVRRLLPAEYQPGTKKQPAPAAPVTPAASHLATYRIHFRPSRTIFQSGTDPKNLLDELTTLGPSRVVAQLGEVPALDALDPEQCYVSWDVILSTDRGIDAIRDVFIFLQDTSDVRIEQIDVEGVLSGDEEYKRLGELLVERGELSLEEIQTIATEQKRLRCPHTGG